MFEELLKGQEITRSILLIDDFKTDSTALLLTILNELAEIESNLIQLYPCYFNMQSCYEKYCLPKPNIVVNELFLKHSSFYENEQLFKTILTNSEKKSYIVFDNVNLILRHYDNNPFKLVDYLNQSNKKSKDIVIMVINKDSVEESFLNQFKSLFQTVINCQKLDKDSNNFKFTIDIETKNFKTAKSTTSNETVHCNCEFKIEKVEKPNLLAKNSAKATVISTSKTNVEDQFKSLTFNVHTNLADLETKNQLILPYELIGQTNKTTTKETKSEESIIYYAPDESDDVDDDDPDEDLNF